MQENRDLTRRVTKTLTDIAGNQINTPTLIMVLGVQYKNVF